MTSMISPTDLSSLLGQPFGPTPQQAAVIGAPSGPTLVVAGAGAGKTETMAARVVWLVANGLATPEQILGLTFTRKAARELGLRIRARLQTLADSGILDDLPADDSRHEALRNIVPTVSTYDAYAGTVVGEYGLLLPMEPAGRIISDTERWMIARDVTLEWPTGFTTTRSLPYIIDDMLALNDEMDNHLVTVEEVEAECAATAAEIDGLPDRDGKVLKTVDSALEKFTSALTYRRELLELVSAYRQRLSDRNLMTFGQQMSKAAQLVAAHPRVGQSQRRRFRVVMLDEYQDTGHAQRILLRNLFGEGQDPGLTVTAVGDPMQSIYGFRGATAANLTHFTSDFPTPQGQAPTLELTTSWRNPARVLDMANTVSRWSMDTDTPLVSPLTSRPGAGSGEVEIGWFDTREEELEWLADDLAARYHGRDTGEPFSAAVLLRKNAEAQPIHDLLIARDVPVEMTAGPGLLEVPEVADVFATLRVVVDPSDDIALLRLLTGVRWNIGASDLQALARRVDQLSRRGRVVETDTGSNGTDSDAGDEDADLSGLSAVVAPHEGDSDPLATVRRRIAEIDREASRVPVGLAEALADLRGMEDFGMSTAGVQRLTELARELRYLRRHSASKPLTDLVADIEKMTGVRTEVLTRYHRDSRRSIGASHLDKFAEVVRSFADLSAATPSALVDYLRSAAEREKGLEPGETEVRTDCVQLLTVHKAKGLEWGIVAVPHATRKTYADAVKRPTTTSWTTTGKVLPSGLRGDARDPLDPDDVTGAPVLDLSQVIDRRGVVEAQEAFTVALGEHAAKEDDRLFYVAATRSEQVLLVSGAAYNNDASTPLDPSVALTLMKDRLVAEAPESVVTWSDLGMVYSKKELTRLEKGPHHREDAVMVPENPAARNDLVTDYERQVPAKPTAVWPRPTLTDPAHPDHSVRGVDGVARGMELVRARLDALNGEEGEVTEGTPDSGTVAAQWEQETRLLIDELTADSVPEVTVPVGARLTATEAVAMKRNPEEFARRRRRPVPLEPRPYTKRGTAFHNWVERHYGTVTLFDEDELPGAADATLTDPALEHLKKRFLDSTWAHRTPASVEGSYSVTLAGQVFEGRIDAVFHDGDYPTTGWTVVDWKTGRRPTGPELAAAEMQLAVYRLAWAQVLGARLGRTVDPDGVRAAFHYVGLNETYEPRELPSARELENLLSLTGTGTSTRTGADTDHGEGDVSDA
ncbi:MAG TPA: UvrD-helicase domain-containing protein [Candidatus Corynebacterium avicola]|uniref:DNA 3'-5' helicase n=1 Tax=Candidatus Corynebacterium avicola TaxID=2838527 RepID=A0A9D1RPG2_9CORY|nr:UvrD-helicase domain-containing protein [Candidatus Corynebacterium avicola]